MSAQDWSRYRGWFVHGHRHVVTHPVQLEMERNAQRRGQSPSRTFPSMSMAGRARARKLAPEEVPRIAEEGPIRLAVGDVASDVVVVPLCHRLAPTAPAPHEA